MRLSSCEVQQLVTDEELAAWLQGQRLSVRVVAESLGGIGNPEIRGSLTSALKRSQERTAFVEKEGAKAVMERNRDMEREIAAHLLFGWKPE